MNYDKIRELLVFLFAALIFAGAVLLIFDYRTGSSCMFAGMLCIIVYYVIKTIWDIRSGKYNDHTEASGSL